jgi:hypothetical protein
VLLVSFVPILFGASGNRYEVAEVGDNGGDGFIVVFACFLPFITFLL